MSSPWPVPDVPGPGQESVWDWRTLVRFGVTCALCHSTVDNSFAPGTNTRPKRTTRRRAVYCWNLASRNGSDANHCNSAASSARVRKSSRYASPCGSGAGAKRSGEEETMQDMGRSDRASG